MYSVKKQDKLDSHSEGRQVQSRCPYKTSTEVNDRWRSDLHGGLDPVTEPGSKDCHSTQRGKTQTHPAHLWRALLLPDFLNFEGGLRKGTTHNDSSPGAKSAQAECCGVLCDVRGAERKVFKLAEFYCATSGFLNFFVFLSISLLHVVHWFALTILGSPANVPVRLSMSS